MTRLIKNYFLEKLIDTRLYFLKEKSELTNFIEKIRNVKKVLCILPVERNEEIIARNYLKQLSQIFASAEFSTFDILSLRKEDVTWLGIPKQQYLAIFLEEKFDLIIDLNSEHNRLCSYVCACMDAPLRLHLAEGKFDKIYNLHIRTDIMAPLQIRYQSMVQNLACLRNSPEMTENQIA